MKKIIDNYIKLANSISVKAMYLKRNVVSRDITEADVSQYTRGHWGTAPAINTIYANLGYYLNKHPELQNKIIVGTGHAGLSVLTNLLLLGKLEEKYKIEPNELGIDKFINMFGAHIRTEINPQYPENIFDGGELGYSLPVAYGIALNNKILVPCIIGDGEAETGTISSTWQLNILLNKQLKGTVLPIINYNALKMGSSSFMSLLKKTELKKYFHSYRYRVYFANKNNLQKKITKSIKHKNSVIIYKSIKGETIPNLNGEKLSGNIFSHKNPLSNLNAEEKSFFLNEWLKVYNHNIDFKFDLNTFNFTSKEFMLNQIVLPDIKNYLISKPSYSNVSSIEKYIAEICDANSGFLITSPDEAISNKVTQLLEKPNTIEILNENICQCLMQGNILSGNSGVIISYEAFMPIANTILSQFMKYIYMCEKERGSKYNSLNYILTSTCWENNYSHQNPEFVSNILIKDWNFVNAYYPKDANNLLHCLEKSLQGINQVNIITISKGVLPQYKTINCDIEIIKDENDPHIILVATGDYVLREVLEAEIELSEIGILTKVIYVTNISKLKNMSENKMKRYFGSSKVLYCYHGYRKTIFGLLENKIKELKVLGYQDLSDITGNSKAKMEKNFIDSKSIFVSAKDFIKTSNNLIFKTNKRSKNGEN